MPRHHRAAAVRVAWHSVRAAGAAGVATSMPMSSTSNTSMPCGLPRLALVGLSSGISRSESSTITGMPSYSPG